MNNYHNTESMFGHVVIRPTLWTSKTIITSILV